MKNIIERLKREAAKAVACEHESFLAEAAVEIERLRDLFKKVQGHCAGDAHPRWGRDPATMNSRGHLLDICNAALD